MIGTEMADHNMLREKLTATSRYRRLVDLRREVQVSRGTIPFSIYAELESRIDEKIRTFDHPICDEAKITVMFSNGLAIELDPEECQSAMDADMRLSSYIFNKYPSAVDFNIDLDSLLGTYDRMEKEAMGKEVPTPDPAPPKPDPSPSGDSLNKKVDLLINKIDRLEKVYSETIPRISSGLDELKAKMDFLYKKMVEEKK